jgi:cardiolipin synthase A/B
MNLSHGSTWALLYLLSEWAIRIAMLVVVPVRRSPEAAKGWLLLAFFLPWPALALYALVGRPTYPHWRRERAARFPPVLRLSSKHTAEHGPVSPHIPESLEQAITLIQNLGHLPPVPGNSVTFLSAYDASVDALVAEIDRAQDHVHLLYFIFADDESGQKVMAALTRATQRGVTCRVLLDAAGSRPWARSVVETLSGSGVAVHRVLALGLRGYTRADLRNHRKIAVVDGHVGFVGSQNIVNADFKPGIVNQELVARVAGPVVRELQAVFARDWFVETEQVLEGSALFPEPTGAGPTVAQVLPSGPDYPGAGIERLIVALVHGARERIVITTPYLIPDEALLDALGTAVLRGVAVHLVVSRVPDQVLVGFAQRSYYDELLAAGVHIHLFRDKLLHAKHLTIDGDLVLIGSSNVDVRSFLLNAEVSVVCYDPTVTGDVMRVQEGYFAQCDLLSAAGWNARPFLVKLGENLARLVSPLL